MRRIIEHPADRSREFLIASYQQGLKRVMDVVGAIMLILLCLPLLLLIALIVILDSTGPVLYRQVRLGKGGKEFEILKFRTMRLGAEEILASHLSDDPNLKISWEKYQKLLNDPRLTRVGRFLRQYSLDELPQLLNVLRGEMSLVGPRPIFPDQRWIYGPDYENYILMRPGLTGLWQVSGRNRLSFAERVLWDREYFLEHSASLDVSILARTIAVVIRKDGAF